MKELNPNLFKCIYIAMSSLTVLEFYKQLAISLGIVPAFRKIDIFNQIQEVIQDLVKNKSKSSHLYRWSSIFENGYYQWFKNIN